ncbi:MAG: sigma-70 family RNA polymerase sigma factor [Anaerolineales bacterium]
MLATPTAEPETNLINRAQQGDRSAYGELVRRHYAEVVRVVYRLCGDSALAEDAAQEAFLRAWVKLPTFQAASPLRNWLLRIVVNVALDVLRKKPEEELEEEQILLVPDPGLGPESALIEKERADSVQRAIQSLPEAARSVLVLREYGELSYQEISGVLDIPVGTVMSRLNYARTRLRAELKQYFLRTESEND